MVLVGYSAADPGCAGNKLRTKSAAAEAAPPCRKNFKTTLDKLTSHLQLGWFFANRLAAEVSNKTVFRQHFIRD
jgi:hypothetical protein